MSLPLASVYFEVLNFVYAYLNIPVLLLPVISLCPQLTRRLVFIFRFHTNAGHWIDTCFCVGHTALVVAKLHDGQLSRQLRFLDVMNTATITHTFLLPAHLVSGGIDCLALSCTMFHNSLSAFLMAWVPPNADLGCCPAARDPRRGRHGITKTTCVFGTQFAGSLVSECIKINGEILGGIVSWTSGFDMCFGW